MRNDFRRGYRQDHRIARRIARIFAGDDEARCLREIAALETEAAEASEGFEVTCRALANIEALRDDGDIARLLDEALDQPAVRRAPPYAKWGWAAAAAVAVVGVFAILTTGIRTDKVGVENIERYVTAVGEQKTVELADGTLAVLNTGTELLVDFDDEVRRTILRRGEAFFDVAADATRRFFVEVDGQSVSVLGTEFNLRKQASGFVLSVAEGQVAIHPVNDPVVPQASRVTEDGALHMGDAVQRRVMAGWIVEFDQAANALVAKQGNPVDMFSWRDGVLNFVDTPLVAVVKELNRYGTKKILIEDPSIMNKSVTATVRIDSINAALKGLALAHSLEVTHNYDHVVIVEKR